MRLVFKHSDDSLVLYMDADWDNCSIDHRSYRLRFYYKQRSN